MRGVTEIIRHYQSSAPVNVEAIIRDLGIELNKNADLDDEIAGQIEKIGGERYKISSNKKDHYFRKRFTLAHELGHYLLHSDLIQDKFVDNKMYNYNDKMYRLYNKGISQFHETQANKFAATLLMPEDLVRECWRLTAPDLRKMANDFQVSPKAMEIRLQGLGLLPE
jgi:Zn-dependent peptidase ImmA (M78 family)